MITLDCSDHIRNDVDAMSKDEVDAALTLSEEEKSRYLGKKFEIGNGVVLEFTEEELKRNILIYKEAVDFAVHI